MPTSEHPGCEVEYEQLEIVACEDLEGEAVWRAHGQIVRPEDLQRYVHGLEQQGWEVVRSGQRKISLRRMTFESACSLGTDPGGRSRETRVFPALQRSGSPRAA